MSAGRLPFTPQQARRAWAGRDLACWCPPGETCHADVLLELVREPAADPAGGPDPR